MGEALRLFFAFECDEYVAGLVRQALQEHANEEFTFNRFNVWTKENGSVVVIQDDIAPHRVEEVDAKHFESLLDQWEGTRSAETDLK